MSAAARTPGKDTPTNAPMFGKLPGNVLTSFGFVFGAKMAAAALAFATMAMVGRFLGPAEFGSFAILRTIMLMLAGLAGPALDTAMVRYTAGKDNPNDGLPFVRAALWAKGALLLLFLVGALTLNHILTRLFIGAESAKAEALMMSMALVGAGFLMLFEWERAYFQSRQQFGKYASLELVAAALRLTLVAVVLWGAQAVQSILVFAAFCATPFFMMAVGTVWMPRGVARLEVSQTLEAAGQVARFAKWVVLACIFTSLAQGTDLLMLGWLNTPEEAVGKYSAARTLMLMGDLAVLSLFSVLLPKASTQGGISRMAPLLRRFTLPAMATALVLSPGLLLAEPVVRLTFGADYRGAGVLFAILLVGTLFSLASAPAGAVIYGMGYPRIISFLEGGKLLIIVVAGYLAIRSAGPIGMAWTVAATKGTIGLLTYACALRLVRQHDGDRGSNAGESLP